jgi:LCP family protein required for cell wall assembly
MTRQPNVSSADLRSDKSSDPWSDWAIESKSSAAPTAGAVQSPGSQPTSSDEVAIDLSGSRAPSRSSGASVPAPMQVAGRRLFDTPVVNTRIVNGTAADSAEDFTGEFGDIDAGQWDDTQFEYLDDDRAYADVDIDDSTEVQTAGPPVRAASSPAVAGAVSVIDPSAVKPTKTKRTKHRRLRLVGLSLLTVIAVTVAYATWQFNTLRRNEADGGILDLPGVVRTTLQQDLPQGLPTTTPAGPQPTTPFNDPQPSDTFPIITNPGPTTAVVTVPGEGTCADDPICANAPVVVLPEIEKPREGGLLVDRVNVEPIGGVNATNILLIGSDSRADLPDAQKAGFGQVGGHRSDTIIVMRMSPDGKVAALLSFPRDTFVHLAGQNKNDRINSAYAKGVNSLIRTVQENFNVPITHAAEIDFNGFQKIVGTLGGIEICFEHPARDKKTQLNVKEAGCQVLNQTQATAYVRSRHYEQLINGVWQSDGRGDIGRVQRQQRFIRQVLQKVIDAGGRNPIQAQALINDLKGALTLDKTWGITELFGTAKTFSNFEPNALQNFTLPTSPANIDGKAVLRVNRPKASEMVAKFGTRR